MKIAKFLPIVCALALTGVAQAQAWSEAYSKALEASKSGQWSAARTAFLEAVALRPDDQATATTLPGPVTEPVIWRGGSPYSPNFGAAYAAFRQALDTKDDAEKSRLFGAASTELEILLAKRQASPELFWVLNQIYVQSKNLEGQRKVEAAFNEIGRKPTWKVDSSFLTPEDAGAIRSAMGEQSGGGTSQAGGGNSGGGSNPIIRAGNETGNTGGTLGTIAGRVPTKPYKFALIIGSSESRIDSLKVGYAASDAMIMRESILQNAGYEDANVDVLINASAAQISATARAMADRIPEGATVMIYFSGVGVSIDGRDYLAGIEAENPTDSAAMVAKEEIFKMFMAKGAKIFAFFQVNRPIVKGQFFGREEPLFGLISQAHATIPGGTVNATVSGGKLVGVYTQAMASTLAEFRSNSIPITEFVWQVFYNIRRGGTGTTGGGSPQTPTLPVVTNMAADARF